MKLTDLPAETLAQAQHLVESIGDLELPDPTGYFILILQYVRPNKVGSLIMPDKVKNEDVYQGRCGLVLALGPDTYKGDKYPSGPWCKPGDWVLWPPVEAAAARLSYGEGITLAFLADDRVIATNMNPLRAVTSG